MMKNFLAVVAVLVVSAGALPALAQQTPPSTTINAPDSSNNAVSNPVGQNTNVQVNNSYAGMNSFGIGIQCATPYLAAGVYNNNTSVNNGTTNLGVANNAGSNNSLGGTLQFVVPVGGKQQSNCTQLSTEILHQRQLDTQITLIQRCADFAKAGITLDSKVFPELAAACVGVHVNPNAAQTSMVPSPAPTTVTVPKLVVYQEPPKKQGLCDAGYHAPSMRDKKLISAWKSSMKHKLTQKGAKLAAEYLRELQSDCVDPVVMAQSMDAP